MKLKTSEVSETSEVLMYRALCEDDLSSTIQKRFGIVKFFMASYCAYCIAHPEDTFNRTYHDTQYGFPLHDDNLLFERLVLEINQAGLSWMTILRKADNFHKAYRGFAVEKVAKYSEKDRSRLLVDAGIIRNRLKVNAAIVNAQRIMELRKEFDSFEGWLEESS